MVGFSFEDDKSLFDSIATLINCSRQHTIWPCGFRPLLKGVGRRTAGDGGGMAANTIMFCGDEYLNISCPDSVGTTDL